MKLGYQDAGSWTLLKSTPVDRRKAAWLYAQFVTSKTVSLKKSHVGLTFIRESDIWDKSMTERAPKLGGLVEFYRSPARVQWTPTGNNVPDYPKLAQLWWQNIGDASSGAKTPQQAMDALAAAQDDVLERLERANVQGECGPKMNPKTSAEDWFKKSEEAGNIAPQPQAREREAEGRNSRLRHADQELARVSAEAQLSRRKDVARTSGGVAAPDQRQEDAGQTPRRSIRRLPWRSGRPVRHQASALGSQSFDA